MSDITFEEIGFKEKIVLLDILGYSIGDEGVIINKSTQTQHICPITERPVFVENASILPGSTVVINTTELSLSEYFNTFIESAAQ